MRTFIAVNFPVETIHKITRVMGDLKSQTSAAAIKWVAPEALHLTLKFIGELPEEKVAEVTALLTKTLQGLSPFEIEIHGLGMYPNAKNPRVIWLGILGGEPLFKIHKILDRALAPLDIPSDRLHYAPHLTLARLRQRTDPEIVRSIGKTVSQFEIDSLGVVVIDQIHLIQSTLTPQGPLYSSLHNVPLDKV